MSVATVTPQQLAERATADPSLRVIDVRSPVEFRGVHAEPAENVPLDALEGDALAQLVDASRRKTLYLICQMGGRGEKACQRLAAAGAVDFCNVAGGTQAWIDAGLPVVREAGVIALERQVRMAAGSLVLVGVLLGWFVHPAFFGLAAFIGAGLVFSGVTNTCGMGMLLARMPWNRTKNLSKY